MRTAEREGPLAAEGIRPRGRIGKGDDVVARVEQAPRDVAAGVGECARDAAGHGGDSQNRRKSLKLGTDRGGAVSR